MSVEEQRVFILTVQKGGKKEYLELTSIKLTKCQIIIKSDESLLFPLKFLTGFEHGSGGRQPYALLILSRHH